MVSDVRRFGFYEAMGGAAISLPTTLEALQAQPGVGEKAAGVIRRIREYARRGDTFSGVPLAPRLRLREVAVGADMTTTLS